MFAEGGPAVTILVELKPDEERVFLERARLSGSDPVRYAQQIIRDHIRSSRDEADPAKSTLEDFIDDDFVADCARSSEGRVPTIDEVRKILAKIPGSLSADIIADREDRF